MAEESGQACLACGRFIKNKGRRVSKNASGKHLIPVWEQLLDISLRRAGKSISSIDKVCLLGDAKSKAPGCLCRKCFTAMQSYYLKQCDLVNNMDKALVQIAERKLSYPTGQKRSAVERVAPSPKRARCSLAQAQRSLFVQSQLQQKCSPGVSVSIIIWKLLYIVNCTCI